MGYKQITVKATAQERRKYSLESHEVLVDYETQAFRIRCQDGSMWDSETSPRKEECVADTRQYRAAVEARDVFSHVRRIHRTEFKEGSERARAAGMIRSRLIRDEERRNMEKIVSDFTSMIAGLSSDDVERELLAAAR